MSAESQNIRFCKALDGTKLAYAVTGTGSPLVMSATWLTHLEHQWRSLAWRPWLDTFSQKQSLLRYDPRGCGLSDRDATDLSFENWITDFEAVVDASGLQKFNLLGTCWGGAIAIEYAARHPERVNSLVLYGTYALGRLRWGNAQESAKYQMLLDLMRIGWGREDHAFLQAWAYSFQPEGTLEHLRSWSDQQRMAATVDVAQKLLQIGWNLDVREAARKIKCPVLIAHADRDMVVPLEQGRQLATLIPDSRFVQIDSPNHMPLPHEPAWSGLVQEIGKFFEEADRADQRVYLPLAELTPRERMVLDKIAEGMDNAEIGTALELSEKTVRNHITRVFDKIGVAHRYEAIVLAREAGLGLNSRLIEARRTRDKGP